MIDRFLAVFGLVRISRVSSTMQLRAARHTPNSGTPFVDVKFPDGKVQRLMLGLSFTKPVRREDITFCHSPAVLPPVEDS